MVRLYFKGRFQSEHISFEEAEAQARWNHFEFYSTPWESFEMPFGFMIVLGQIDHTLISQENKTLCISA